MIVCYRKIEDGGGSGFLYSDNDFATQVVLLPRLIEACHLFLHRVNVLKIHHMYGHVHSAQLGRCPHSSFITRSRWIH